MGIARIAATKWCSQVALHFMVHYLVKFQLQLPSLSKDYLFINAHLIWYKVLWTGCRRRIGKDTMLSATFIKIDFTVSVCDQFI